jgi:type I restriction enzyme S subunit
LKSNSFTQFNDSTSSGSTIQHLYQNVFVDFSFSFPSISEQTTIASFLDYKTAQIDALIAKKGALLDKLAEKRTALISHAVSGNEEIFVKLHYCPVNN